MLLCCFTSEAWSFLLLPAEFRKLGLPSEWRTKSIRTFVCWISVQHTEKEAHPFLERLTTKPEIYYSFSATAFCKFCKVCTMSAVFSFKMFPAALQLSLCHLYLVRYQLNTKNTVHHQILKWPRNARLFLNRSVYCFSVFVPYSRLRASISHFH